MKKIKTSLREKTTNLLIIILSLFSLAFLISSSIIQRKESDDLKIRTTEIAVENVASSVNSTIDNYNYVSRLIMLNDRVVSFLNAETVDLDTIYEARMGIYDALNLYSNISYIESVYIFRNDGTYVSTGKGEFLIDMSHPEWDRIYARRGSRTISISGNGMLQKIDGTPSLTLSRAIYDIYTQKLIGVLVMSISNSCFEDVLDLQDTDGICILDEQGNWLCGDEGAAKLYRRQFNSEDLVCRTTYYKGRRGAAAGKNVQEALVVVGYTNKISLWLPLETACALILALVVCSGSVLYYTWFIRKNLSDPIIKLGEAMEQTKSSGWQPIEEEMPNSDLSRLTDSYNSMVAYLDQLFERLRQEEEMIRKAEMRVLHEQIKPHFLYNTLETISYIAVQEQASHTYDALETLGSFYRNFLSGGAREIPFRRELSIAKDYLSLQKLRYGDSFEDEYAIDDDTLDYMVPKLILQPLVENSIYHGIKPKGEFCVIRITAYCAEDGLHILVYDSGVGMSKSRQAALQSPSDAPPADDVFSAEKGIGLTGTIARIRYYCNNENVVSIRSEEGEYTEIELLIPRQNRAESENRNV